VDSVIDFKDIEKKKQIITDKRWNKKRFFPTPFREEISSA